MGASTVWPLTRVLLRVVVVQWGGFLAALPAAVLAPHAVPRWRFMVPAFAFPSARDREETQDLIEHGVAAGPPEADGPGVLPDGLMYEQYRMDSGNTRDMALIHSYFEHAGAVRRVGQAAVDGAAEVTGHRAPRPHLARLCRQDHREEEKIDRRTLDRKRQTGFVPPGRPKNWKRRCSPSWTEQLPPGSRHEADTRESDRMWLVRSPGDHTEVRAGRTLTVAKNLCWRSAPRRTTRSSGAVLRTYQALSARMQDPRQRTWKKQRSPAC